MAQAFKGYAYGTTQSGSITAAAGGANVSLIQASTIGSGSVGIQITGTWTGTLTFTGSVDGINFTAMPVEPIAGGNAVTTTTANGIWTATVAGLQAVNVDGTSGWASGTAVVTIHVSEASNPAALGGGGSAILGKVGIDQTTPGTTNNVAQNDPAATTGSITAADAVSATSTGASGQTLITGAPTAGSAVQATLSGHTSAMIELTNFGSATVQVEKSMDGGTTWIASGATRQGQIGSDSSMTTNGVWHVNVAGLTTLRVRCPAASYTSGTIGVRIQPGYGVGTLPVSILSGNVNNNLLSAGIATRLCYPTVAGSATLEKTKWPSTYTLSPAALPVVGSGIAGVTALTEAAAVVGGVFSPGPGWGGVLLDFAAVSGADATMVVEIGKLTATACMPQKIASVSLKTITTSGTFTANFDPFTGAAQATTTFRLFDLATITSRNNLGQLLVANGGTENDTPCQLILDVSDAPFYYVLLTTLGVTGPVTICLTPVA